MKLFAQHSTRIKQSYATRTASHPFLDQRTILRTIAHTMRPGHHACVRRQMASRALRGLTRLARRCERVCTSRIRNAVFATPSSNARKTVKTPYLASDGNRSPIFCQSSREMQAAASPSGSPSTLRICCKRRRRAALRSSRRAEVLLLITATLGAMAYALPVGHKMISHEGGANRGTGLDHVDGKRSST